VFSCPQWYHEPSIAAVENFASTGKRGRMQLHADLSSFSILWRSAISRPFVRAILRRMSFGGI
jgi:hypothetical protein